MLTRNEKNALSFFRNQGRFFNEQFNFSNEKLTLTHFLTNLLHWSAKICAAVSYAENAKKPTPINDVGFLNEQFNSEELTLTHFLTNLLHSTNLCSSFGKLGSSTRIIKITALIF